MKKIFILPAFVLGLWACNPGGDISVTVINKGTEKEYLIHLKKVQDSIHLNLSDIAKDFEFIKMETKPECIFEGNEIYVTDSYILVEKNNYGILQFDSEGKFIRTLVKVGEGPKEYSRAHITVSEKDNILYVSDMRKDNYFLQFDLQSGEYLGNLNKAIPGQTKDIRYVDNSLLVVPSGSSDEGEKPSYYYYQSLEGELLHSRDAPAGFFMRWGGKSLHKETRDILYHIPDDDTVYRINNKDMNPYLVFDFGEKNPEKRSVGHNSMSLNREIGSLLFFYNFNITSIEKVGDVTYTSGAVENYILDKEVGKASQSGKMFFNPTHQDIDGDHYQFRLFEKNGFLYYIYPAVDLIEHGKKALADKDFKEPYRSLLSEILKNLDENDNPVLLVGKLL